MQLLLLFFNFWEIFVRFKQKGYLPISDSDQYPLSPEPDPSYLANPDPALMFRKENFFSWTFLEFVPTHRFSPHSL
jgi:hypothetical protein